MITSADNSSMPAEYLIRRFSAFGAFIKANIHIPGLPTHLCGQVRRFSTTAEEYIFDFLSCAERFGPEGVWVDSVVKYILRLPREGLIISESTTGFSGPFTLRSNITCIYGSPSGVPGSVDTSVEIFWTPKEPLGIDLSKIERISIPASIPADFDLAADEHRF